MADPISALSPQIHRLQEAIEASKKMAPLSALERAPLPFSQDTLSVSKAEIAKIPPASHPKLTPPEKSSPSMVSELLKLQLLAEKRKETADVNQEEVLEHAIHRHQELFLQHAKKEAEFNAQMENSSSWERYRQIATFFSTALPFFGAAVSASGGPATAHLTYLLLAAGSSSLFNEAMRQTNSWQWLFGHFVSDEKTKVLLASVVEKTIAISSSLLGAISLGNFATSFQVATSNFWNANDAFNFTLALKTLTDLSSTFLGIQKAISNAKAAEIQRESTLSDRDASAYKNNCDLAVKALKEDAKNQEQMSKICHEALLSHQALIASTV